jgi:hypothetical protein
MKCCTETAREKRNKDGGYREVGRNSTEALSSLCMNRTSRSPSHRLWIIAFGRPSLARPSHVFWRKKKRAALISESSKTPEILDNSHQEWWHVDHPDHMGGPGSMSSADQAFLPNRVGLGRASGLERGLVAIVVSLFWRGLGMAQIGEGLRFDWLGCKAPNLRLRRGQPIIAAALRPSAAEDSLKISPPLWTTDFGAIAIGWNLRRHSTI